MLLMDIIGFECKNLMKHIGLSTQGGKIHSFLMVQQMVHVVTTGR